MNAIFALLFAATIYSCYALPPTDPNCRWTGCEGLFYTGVSICKHYGGRRYTGKTNSEGCGWDTVRVECCHPYSAGSVKWTTKCYGTNEACSIEFGPEFVITGNKQACSGVFSKYECKN